MSTIFQKYGASIASFVVVLLTAVSVLPSKVTTVDLFQLVVLLASAVGIFFVPLLKGKWAAGGKMAIELVGILFITLIPFWANGAPTREQIIVIIIAVIKAAATQLGVVIRTEVPVATVTTQTVGDVSVTSEISGLVSDPASAGKHVA